MIRIEKILCPVDFSDNAEHALQYAIAFAVAYEAELEIMHVVQPAVYGVGAEGLGADLQAQFMKEVHASSSLRLDEVVSRVEQKLENVSAHVVTGVPFVEIIKRAKATNVDLIVMGTHGRSGVAHVLIGSCAERVVRKAPCPVLTVKNPAHDFVMP